MQVEDRLGRIGQLCRFAIDRRQQLVLGQLARRVPGGRIRVAHADHGKASGQLDHGSLGVDNAGRSPQQVVDERRVVVSGRHVANDVAAIESILGQREPALDGLLDASMEDVVHRGGRRLELTDPVDRGLVGVVAGVGDQLADRRELGLGELPVPVEDPGRPAPVAVVDDRHQHLASHVAAHDQHLAVVKARRVEELPKAAVRGVDVGHEEGTVISHERSPRGARTRARGVPPRTVPATEAISARFPGRAGSSPRVLRCRSRRSPAGPGPAQAKAG